jgi:hypothetical protein
MRWQRQAMTAFALLGTLVLGRAGEAHAGERWTQYGLRPLGMGNAFVAVVDDYNALFYNPAGLARLKSWDGEFLNPMATVSKGFDNLRKNTQIALEEGTETAILDLIEQNAGENFHLGLGLTPHLIFPHFGFALALDLSNTIVFHRDISVDLDTGLRLTLPVAFAMNFLDERLSIGAAIKLRARGGIDREFSIDDIEAFQNDEKDSNGKNLDDYVLGGSGYGADIGLLFTPIKTFEPTFGLSITDLGGTTYKEAKLSDTDSTGAPPLTLPSVNIGMSLKPLQKDRLYLLTSVDMHAINQPSSFSKKLNLGTELGYGSLIKVQAGLYQGYLTAGLQFDVSVLNIRLITYAEELGSVAGYKEDRRYAAQIKLLL